MKRGWLFLLCLIVLFGFVFAKGAEYVPGEILVKYNDSIIRTASAKDIKVLDINDNYIRLKVDDNLNIEDLAEELEVYEDVVYAQPNYIYRIFDYPNDPMNGSQWALSNVDMFDAWGITKGSEEVIIAVIDTGANLSHEDLVNKLWNNSEGYHGYDFVNNDNFPEDDHGHGTHCAGIAGAETNNSLGIAGICPNCKLMIIKAANSEGISNSETIADALGYAIANNATIISMSFGTNSTSPDNTLSDAIDRAYEAGVILVAAAGNEGDTTENYPAGYENVISVGATTSSNQKASYSNYGSWVNIFAPGFSILSTYLSGSYDYMDGTSMATPLIAGAIGLIKSLNPELNQTEILDILNDSADILTDAVAGNISKINVYSALQLVDYIVVNLESPNDGNKTNMNETNFTCSANSSISNLTNITFFLHNETNLIYNLTNELIGLDNSSMFNYTFENESNYTWYCQACNDNSICKFSENYTIAYDLTVLQPEITNRTLFLEIFLDLNFEESANYSLNYSKVGEETFNETNSSDFFENHSVNITDLEGGTEYEFNLTFCDLAANCNFTEFNLTTLSIFVNLTSPANETYTNINGTNFTCEINSSESYNLTNVTFFLYNSTGETATFSNLTLEGFYNSSIFNYVLEYEDNYSWTCLAFNNKSDNYSSLNYTLFYDVTVPEVTLSSDVTTTTATINIGSNEQVNYSISGDISGNSSEYNNSHNVSIDGLSCGNSYDYNLICCDRAGNCNETSSIIETSSCPVSSPSGGSYSPPSFPTEPVIGTSSNPVSLLNIGSSYNEKISVGEKIYFKLSVDSVHSITLSQIVNNFVVLVVQSEPITIYLSENETKKLSLDTLNAYDIEIIVNSISENFADVEIRRIDNSINYQYTEISDEGEPAEEPPEEDIEIQKSLTWLYWVGSGILILVIAFFVWFFHGNKLRRQELLLNLLHTKNHEEIMKKN